MARRRHTSAGTEILFYPGGKSIGWEMHLCCIAKLTAFLILI